MERFFKLIISFAPHIIFPLIYMFFAGGKKGFINRINSVSTQDKGKIMLYNFTIGVMAVLYWIAAIYIFMNIFLIILNLIPGIAI